MIYTYSRPEEFESYDKIDLLKYNGRILLWGAGRVGGVAEYVLRKAGVDIIGFCDIAKDKWHTTFCGHTIFSPQEIEENYKDAVIIITTVFHNSIYEKAVQMGFKHIFDATSLFMKIDFKDYDFWMTPEYAIRNIEQYLAAIKEQKEKMHRIDQVFLNITTKCTLRCKHCSMFIPYINEPCIYQAEEIMQDLRNVLDSLGHVRVVNFYGGEPFIHSDLAWMIRSLKDEKRIDRISIITNATLMPSRELIDAMKEEERIWLRISDYGDLSKKSQELISLLKEQDIFYEVANYTYWDQPSKIGYMDIVEEELVKKFKECTACNVLFLLNRKGYLCSTGSAVCNIGAFPESESNYFDLKKYENESEKMKEALTAFISRPHTGEYMDACRYCSGGHCVQYEEKVPVAIQTKELLSFGMIEES